MANLASASRHPETEPSAAVSADDGPPPAAAPALRPAVEVIVVTVRDDFLLELGEMLDGQASVRPVESVSAALELLTSTRRSQVLVIDTRDAGDVRADLELATARAPSTRVLVFATAEAEKQVSTAVQGSSVLAILPLPLEDRETRTALASAIANAVSEQGAARIDVSSQAEPAPAPSESAPRGKTILWIASAVGLLVLAAAAFWLLTQGKGGPASPAGSSAAAARGVPASQGGAVSGDTTLAAQPDTAILKGKVDELLEKARAALRERRYTEPAGDNALLYYRSAAAADAASGEARDGLQRVAGVLASRFDAAMSDGHLEEAALALANFKLAGPQDSRLASFEQRLALAQMKLRAELAQRQEAARAERERAARDRANAIAAAQRDLDTARQKAAQVEAERLAQQPAHTSAVPAQTRPAGADLRDNSTSQQIETAPKAGAADGDGARALTAELKRTRYVAPEYPDRAISEGVSGSVTVEYTVDKKGNTRDVRVVEATAPGIFDRAAVSAVKRWRFQPVIANGAPVEVPARISIRFELPKGARR